MPYAPLHGEQIFFERVGSGPPLLLLHSLGTASWLWQNQITHWQAHYEVIAPDARGHGASSNHGGFSIRAVAEDFVALLAHLAVGPAHIIAISMGGPIAAAMYDIAPDCIKSLVIADSFATQGDAGAARAAMIAASIRAGTMRDYGHKYAVETLAEDTQAQYLRPLTASIAAMQPEDYIQAAHAVFTADSRANMRKIAVPTKVIVGAADQRTPPALSEAICQLISGATLHVIDGAKHLANLDKPTEFNAAVDSFLARL